MTREETHSRPRQLSPGMRRLLVVAGVLVVLAGLTLYVFPLRTAELFAWTITPPMTAVFLGASYWAAAAIELMAATRRWWAEARIAVPGVFLFTVLTLIVTLVHLDRFHLAAELSLGTRLITWAWLAIYALVPVFMAIVWIRQSRLSGGDPPRTAGLPPLTRVTLGLQAAVLAVCGSGLLIAPVTFSALWPWQLTPLTGRAIGAWLVGLAVVAAQELWENDVRRFRPAAVGSLVFAFL